MKQAARSAFLTMKIEVISFFETLDDSEETA
jgi:hypothetical protein